MDFATADLIMNLVNYFDLSFELASPTAVSTVMTRHDLKVQFAKKYLFSIGWNVEL